MLGDQFYGLKHSHNHQDGASTHCPSELGCTRTDGAMTCCNDRSAELGIILVDLTNTNSLVVIQDQEVGFYTGKQVRALRAVSLITQRT